VGSRLVSTPPLSDPAAAPLTGSLSYANKWQCYGVLFSDSDVHDDGESDGGALGRLPNNFCLGPEERRRGGGSGSTSRSLTASDPVNKSQGEAQFVLTLF
jgi:hypothetical protein